MRLGYPFYVPETEPLRMVRPHQETEPTQKFEQGKFNIKNYQIY